MVGIFKNTCGQRFTGKVAKTKAEAIWWIYQQYKKPMNVVSFYKKELNSVEAIYYIKELEEI